MNTDTITLTEILGTDSVSGSRIIINSNFSKLAKAVSDIQTRIDTSKNTIYANIIDTESGDFVIKTTPNHTVRFRIDNAGEIYIGGKSLDEYIRNIIENTKIANLTITDENDNLLEWSNISNVVTVYTSLDEYFANIEIDENILTLYPNGKVEIYDSEGENPIQYEFVDFFDGETTEKGTKISSVLFDANAQQASITLIFIPGASVHERYSFKVEKI